MSFREWLHNQTHTHAQWLLVGEVGCLLAACIENKQDYTEAYATARCSAQIDYQLWSLPPGVSSISSLVTRFAETAEYSDSITEEMFISWIADLGGVYQGIYDGRSIVKVPDYVEF